jgi:uncharacterized membrane protein YkoI
MQRPTKAVIAGIAVVAAVGAGTTMALASGSDDDPTDTPISSPDLEKATAAALAHTGGGRVTGTEVGDEDSLYEVEVTLDDGRQVDVQLDESFAVVGDEADDGEND